MGLIEENKKKWERTTIGTTEYCFEDIPAEPAAELWLELMSVFGEGVGALLATSEKDGIRDDMAIDKAIMSLARSVKPKEIMAIVRHVIKYVFINERGKDGRRADFGDFQGKTIDLYKIIFFAIRYNYADVFTVALQRIGNQSVGGPDA
jgi:hypothetical protein